MWKVIVLCTILGLAIAQKARFNNYKVFRIIPNTEAQVEILRQLEEVPDGVSKSFPSQIFKLQIYVQIE